MAAEDVDEHDDQDPEPDHQQKDLQDRPEHPEQRVGVRTRSEQHGVSLARSRLASAASGRMVNASAMIVLGSAGIMLADTLTEEGYRLACPMPDQRETGSGANARPRQDGPSALASQGHR